MSSMHAVDEYVPVLLYHSIAAGIAAADDPWQVRADDFRADMEAVVESGRTAMTATQYASWLTDTDSTSVNPILVTFDDGFADYADVALQVLRETGLVATLFVTTGWVGRKGMLSRSAVAALAGSTTEIGAHSVSHPHLDTVGQDAAKQEMKISREALEDWTGDWVTSMAYPHGSHSRRTKTLARESGYVTAHAVKNALSHSRDDVLAVGRYTVCAATGRERVRAVLAGHRAPLAWHRERVRTRVYRPVRKFRAVLASP
jgi:peptidoglycan/xylan/chitin deacetylase (PgdA/CDA1 family)